MTSGKPLRIFFSAGEPSGDLHAANLIRRLQARSGRIEAVGYGGPQMAAAGCRLHRDLTELAVMWFARALANLHQFWGLMSRADRYFRHQRPDAVVLVDYPGFNWWIARRAKVHRIPVFYYVPPQIWAWAQWRVGKMRRLADHVLASLPFEETWLRSHGANATFVGHPFFDEVRRQVLDVEFLRRLAGQAGPLVTILPGSRTQEVQNNLGDLLTAAAKIRRAVPNARLAVAAFKPHQAQMARREIAARTLDCPVYLGKTPELMQAAAAAMAVSGSVSLELLYHATPTVILYRLSPLAFRVQSWFRKVKYITLVNLLAADELFPEDVAPFDPGQPDADKVLFPEYLTSEDKSEQLAAHVIEWLTDAAARDRRVAALAELKARVAQPGAADRAAEYIVRTLAARPEPVPRPHFVPWGLSQFSRRENGTVPLRHE